MKVLDHQQEDKVEEGVGLLGRFGVASRGVVYCLLGVLAVQVALGDHGEQLDKDGALRAVARQRFGTFLLGAIAVGFAGYALWRFAEAAVADHKWWSRLLYVFRGALYTVFTVTAVRLITGRDSASPKSEDQAKTWSARLMAEDWGRQAVIAFGVGLIVFGAVLAWRGIQRKFEKKLKTSEMSGWQREWLPKLGVAGHTARGAVVALIGVFFVKAAVDFDPQQAVGVDGALHQLAARSYGPIALVVVAVGLVCFGLFSFVEARWRRLLGDD
jgi:hypothetical protein